MTEHQRQQKRLKALHELFCECSTEERNKCGFKFDSLRVFSKLDLEYLSDSEILDLIYKLEEMNLVTGIDVIRLGAVYIAFSCRVTNRNFNSQHTTQ